MALSICKFIVESFKIWLNDLKNKKFKLFSKLLIFFMIWTGIKTWQVNRCVKCMFSQFTKTYHDLVDWQKIHALFVTFIEFST